MQDDPKNLTEEDKAKLFEEMKKLKENESSHKKEETKTFSFIEKNSQ